MKVVGSRTKATAKAAPRETGADRGQRYRSYVKQQLAVANADAALRQAIGGEFDAIGAMQVDLLISQGLTPSGSVVDVGCGSGRLALPLSQYLDQDASYLGTDVVPDLLDYARAQVDRPGWRFEKAPGLRIPAEDRSADIVCFFSVFTHLRHEHSYRYLRQAKRVIKPGGRIVVSFLEFQIYSHWSVFAHNVKHPHADKPLDQFMSRDGWERFAEHLDLRIETILDGDQANIPLRAPITMEDGRVFTDLGALGQSVIVLSK